MIARYRAWVATPRHSERGGGLVEFAIAALFLFTVVFGILDFGRAMFAYDLVANAARLGSRYAIVRGSACTVTGCPTNSTAVQTYVQGASPGISALSVATNWTPTTACSTSPSNNGPGCLVTVTASYQFKFVAFPFAQLTMTSVSQMPISQ